MTITEFILARITEDEETERGRHDHARVLAECEAKRRIVELHKQWPVLIERRPTFESQTGADINTMTMRMTQQIAWITQQEYRNRFGTEPPTAPMIRTLAAIWSDHPDYQTDWRPEEAA